MHCHCRIYRSTLPVVTSYNPTSDFHALEENSQDLPDGTSVQLRWNLAIHLALVAWLCTLCGQEPPVPNHGFQQKRKSDSDFSPSQYIQLNSVQMAIISWSAHGACLAYGFLFTFAKLPNLGME